ncbi:MAG: glycosyltransferase family 2 protein [Chloroflexi bacterium]|nr:glycosyltransferase family 2 protein [Chloroflexota bacterium]
MVNLAAVILTTNEAHNITACVGSVRGWVDAVIVWDGGSTDATCALAKKAGALVVQRPFDNFAAQRQAVLDTIEAEWILFIDADERVTPALAREIMAAVQDNAVTPSNRPAGYWIPRRNFIVEHETRGGGFFPDYQLRLLKRQLAHYPLAQEVHEFAKVTGEVERLAEPLLHYNYTSWRQFYRKQRTYAAYEARILAARGIRPRPHNFILQPLREFYRRFVTLRGWQDGWHGLYLAGLLAWYYGLQPYWLLLTDRGKVK